MSERNENREASAGPEMTADGAPVKEPSAVSISYPAEEEAPADTEKEKNSAAAEDPALETGEAPAEAPASQPVRKTAVTGSRHRTKAVQAAEAEGTSGPSSRREARKAALAHSQEKYAERLNKESSMSSFAQLCAAKDAHIVLQGSVLSCDAVTGHVRTSAGERVRVNSYVAGIILDARYKVRIPLEELVSTDVFDREFVNMDTESGRKDYSKRQRRLVESYIGMEVPFVITEILGSHEEPVVLGSRLKALAILQRRYYGGASPQITPGTIVNADIIAAGKQRIWVCCGGVDTPVFRGDLTFDYVPVVSDVYKVGSKIPVKVREIRYGKDGRVEKILVNAKDAFLEEQKSRLHLISRTSTMHAVISTVKQNGDKITALGMIRQARIAILINEFAAGNLSDAPRGGDTVKVTVRDVTNSGLVICSYHGTVGSPLFAEYFT